MENKNAPQKVSTKEALALYPQATMKYIESPYVFAPAYDTLWDFEGTLWLTETSPEYGVSTSRWDPIRLEWNCMIEGESPVSECAKNMT